MEMPLEYIFDLPETRGRPRSYHRGRAASTNERKQKQREAERADRLEHIAVLDFETEPFDDENEATILPFAACLYSDLFDPVVIWNNNFDAFVNEVIDAIEALPGRFTIYAHNGGKFDFMFLVHRLRGRVSFKGRGIMSAKIGHHDLRDSYNLIPQKLADIKKDEFDYSKMKRENREKHRAEIVKYMVHDCEYLLDVVREFLGRFGLKLSVGQAAMAELKKFYQIDRLGENADEFLRSYFYGGRVECIAGRGLFEGDYKLYDVNSMYPFVMATYQHPVGNDYSRRMGRGVGPNTVFVECTCENYGALIGRDENGALTAGLPYGRFLTTIWEFETALELDLIDRVKVHSVIDCNRRTDFAEYVLPIYKRRQQTKTLLDEMKKAGHENTREFFSTKKDDLFLKLLLNTGYGKFAQNPRKFKEYHITDADDPAPEGFEDEVFPYFKNDVYAIWRRPQKIRYYNNVGTAASITGAARSVLMRALSNALDPIYCDTDSVICRALDNVETSETELGAWSIEAQFRAVIIAGKKLYATRATGQDGQIKVKSKGVSGLSWDHLVAMLDDEIVTRRNRAPTLTREGRQFYITRRVRATAPWRRGNAISAHSQIGAVASRTPH